MNATNRISELPVAVIGAGPVGLAAAAHLQERGMPFVVIERGDFAGSAVAAWGHVRLFSPWRYCIDAAAQRLLLDAGWTPPPPETFPTGAEFITQYLAPLSRTHDIAPHLMFAATVTSISRAGRDKLSSGERGAAPFALHLQRADGSTQRLLARAVIDASGTWHAPAPLGADGTPASGESAAGDRIDYGIPDVLGAARHRFADQRILVVGGGHSASHAILDLASLRTTAPRTRIEWAIRRPDATRLIGGGDADQLPERGAIGTRIARLLHDHAVTLHTGMHVVEVVRTTDGALMVQDENQRALGPYDRIIAATGFRPDLAMLRELRLDIDDRCEAPRRLAPMIDPNLHSCGSVPPHGAHELAHFAEPGFYIAGSKSYGRAPTFLMLTGYEQVRSIVADIAGDAEEARAVRLVLPETGVCCGPSEIECCPAPGALISLDDIGVRP
jgi:thioredoxin reductase